MKAWTCVLAVGLSFTICHGQDAAKEARPYVPRTLSGGIPKSGERGAPQFQSGALEVTISPEGARNSSARWKIVGTDHFHSSGDRVQVAPGNYTIDFTKIEGFTKPAPVAVRVQGDVATAVGKYEKEKSKDKEPDRADEEKKDEKRDSKKKDKK